MKHLSLPRFRPASSTARRQLLFALAGMAGLVLAGCGGTVSTAGGATTPTAPAPPPVANYQFLTGNWEFQVTPSAGTTAPFTTMAGFINEQGQNPGNFDESTAVFQVQPTSNCYDGAVAIPLAGNVQGDTAKYSSFSDNGQYLGLVLTRDTPGTHLTGTYSDTGGCVKGVSGTIAGVKYTSLTGTYKGPITGSTPNLAATLSLTQGGQGTGSGVTEVSGSGVFTGFACFTKGNVDYTQSYVLGSAVVITIPTNDPTGAQVVITGSFDQGATTITVSSIQVTSGSCSGSYGTTSLTVQ